MQVRSALPPASTEAPGLPASEKNAEGSSSSSILLIGLLALAYTIWNMDKVNLSVAVVPMVKQFQWSPSVVGTIQSSFFWGYVLMQIPGGVLARALGGKTTLLLGFALFSLATCLIPSAASAGIPYLLAARALVGIGEGATPPAATALIAQSFGPTDRARAFSVVGFSQNVGAVVGLLASPFVIDSYGWPAVFVLFGGLGLVWAAVWAVLGKEPAIAKPEPTKVSAETADQSVVINTLLRIPWAEFLRHPPVWAVIVVHFCYNWGFYTLLAWTPTYFSSALGFDLKTAAGLAILPYVCVALASVAAGYIADSLITKGWSTTSARKVMQSGAFLGASVFFLALGVGLVPVDSPPLCIACLSAAFVCAAGSFGGLFCSWADLSPKYAGPLNGLSSTAGALGGVLGNSLAGQLLDETGSWGQAVFLPTMACFLIGTACWNLLYEADEVDFDAAAERELVAKA